MSGNRTEFFKTQMRSPANNDQSSRTDDLYSTGVSAVGMQEAANCCKPIPFKTYRTKNNTVRFGVCDLIEVCST